jgi:hypothetical protein
MRSLALILLAACTTTTPTGPGGVYPESATEVQLSISGGFAPMAAPGSTCQPIDDHYTYATSARQLSWSICSSPTDDLVFQAVTGHTTLSAGDAQQLVDALGAVQLAETGCGGDVTETLVFATPDNTRGYQANCMPGADAVIQLFQSDAH